MFWCWWVTSVAVRPASRHYVTRWHVPLDLTLFSYKECEIRVSFPDGLAKLLYYIALYKYLYRNQWQTHNSRYCNTTTNLLADVTQPRQWCYCAQIYILVIIQRVRRLRTSFLPRNRSRLDCCGAGAASVQKEFGRHVARRISCLDKQPAFLTGNRWSIKSHRPRPSMQTVWYGAWCTEEGSRRPVRVARTDATHPEWRRRGESGSESVRVRLELHSHTG